MSMTREEAILELETMIAGYAFNADEAMALGMAIDALRPASREQVEKVWRGEWEYAHETIIGNFSIVQCSKCGHEAFKKALHVTEGRFCPACGAAMTDEAVDMVMKRLEGMKNGE